MVELKAQVGEIVSYWERRRVVYNLVLLILVVICWGADIWASGPMQWLGAFVVLSLFALGANALYCLAYPVDLALSFSPLKRHWLPRKWILFTTGMVLAAGLSLWIMLRPGMA